MIPYFNELCISGLREFCPPVMSFFVSFHFGLFERQFIIAGGVARNHLTSLGRVKPVNLFPVTSPAMEIAITKRKKSREIKHEKWETGLSQSQLTNSKFTLNINLRTLAQGTVGF